jgi:hypothetical protein
MRDQQRSVDYLDFWSVTSFGMVNGREVANFIVGSMSHSTCRFAATMCASFVGLFL